MALSVRVIEKLEFPDGKVFREKSMEEGEEVEKERKGAAHR